MPSNDLYVFISYARPDQEVAEKVEACLTDAGVRVFRDASDIRTGANWDLAIEEALPQCQRLVLLLSPSSMPYRKELHREWFYFDQQRKPIYPLYIADCELHSRFFAYNYIDARGKKGWLFPYGKTFDASKCNTFESHIRRTTPIGIFDNATPEGAFDLSGNAYTWTLSIYDQDKFPYEDRSDDGREDIHQTGVRRVLRGGSWIDDDGDARRLSYRQSSRRPLRRSRFSGGSGVSHSFSPSSIALPRGRRASRHPSSRSGGFRQCWSSTLCQPRRRA